MVKRDGRVQFEPVPGSEFEIPADLVLLAMGFIGPEKRRAARRPRRDADRPRQRRRATRGWMTNVPGVFTAGDMQRGQSLIVWAIAEGRSAARAIDRVPDGRVAAAGAARLGAYQHHAGGDPHSRLLSDCKRKSDFSGVFHTPFVVRIQYMWR